MGLLRGHDEVLEWNMMKYEWMRKMGVAHHAQY
jgi:hypothetical protein